MQAALEFHMQCYYRRPRFRQVVLTSHEEHVAGEAGRVERQQAVVHLPWRQQQHWVVPRGSAGCKGMRERGTAWEPGRRPHAKAAATRPGTLSTERNNAQLPLCGGPSYPLVRAAAPTPPPKQQKPRKKNLRPQTITGITLVGHPHPHPNLTLSLRLWLPTASLSPPSRVIGSCSSGGRRGWKVASAARQL